MPAPKPPKIGVGVCREKYLGVYTVQMYPGVVFGRFGTAFAHTKKI